MSLQKFRVMVVDDEADIRSIVTMSLQPEFEVVQATNGLDAMLKVGKYDPDLMIVDIMMPLMNGLELAEKIRANPQFQHMPIIALSALDSKEDIKKGYGSGANLYLTKPFDPERLRKNVEMTLEGHHPRTKSLTLAEINERECRQADHLKRALENRPKPRAMQEHQQFDSDYSSGASDIVPRAMPSQVSIPKLREDHQRHSSSSHEVVIPPPPSRQTPVPPAAPPPSSSQRVEKLPGAAPHIPQMGRREFNNPKVVKSFAEKEEDRQRKEMEQARAELEAMVTGAQARFHEHRPRILIADDEQDFLDYVRLALESQYEIVTAHDGMDALNKIALVEPDLFIIDGMMPKMSGYQLIDAINSAADTRGKPIIFVSAKGGSRDQRMVFAKGITHYLVKPFETDLLIEAVAEIVNAESFTVCPKTHPLEEILVEEGKRREKEEVFEERKKRWQTYGTIERFLKDFKESDPFERNKGNEG